MNNTESVALSNCDREPVHIPGRIQSFGAMVGFNLESGLIQYESENCAAAYFGRNSSLLGTEYGELFESSQITHSIRGALNLPTIRSQRDRIGCFEKQGKLTDIAVYSTGQTAVIEFEPATVANSTQTPVAMVRSMMTAIRDGEGLLPLLETSVQALRHFTGHDRVMAYRFFENGDGEVVAEAKGPGIEPYLGLRYPASDIPTQVRQIMLRSPFRIIHNIHEDHVALVQAPEAPPLDMTFSHLRGISPIHVEYLQNMGVRATMNISIIVAGRLWGMFAFHHYRPLVLSPDSRSICELFGQLGSMLVQQEEEREKIDYLRKCWSTVASVSERGTDLREVIQELEHDLLRLFQADGLALVSGEEVKRFGDTPSESIVHELCNMTDNTLAIESLQQTKDWTASGEDLGKSAGVLIHKIAAKIWLAIFRDEIETKIRWAGGKEKVITQGPNGPRLAPRGSFAEYQESIKGRCLAWKEPDLSAIGEVGQELAKLVQLNTSEISETLQKQRRYQDLLIAELNHRVRNTLALVRSISRQTQSSSTSLENYVDALERRLAALSTAHELLGGSGLQWARIEELLLAELKPFMSVQLKLDLEGKNLAIRADVAPLISLLFHEMTSNAVKHGALSPSGESLSVRWYEDAGGVAIEWIEQLKDPIRKPDRNGFGFSLLKRALPYECNGKSSIEFDSHRLSIRFWLPNDSICRLADGESEPLLGRDGDSEPLKLDLSHLESALVVEDNLVLAMEMERILRELGILEVTTVPTAELANQAMETSEFAVAVLDINLGATTSYQIAEAVVEKGTAIVLVSGYTSKFELPPHLSKWPRLLKPVGLADLTEAVLRSTGERH